MSFRHCERSEAIHSFFLLRYGLLRCARNDVSSVVPASEPTHNHRKWGYAKVVEQRGSNDRSRSMGSAFAGTTLREFAGTTLREKAPSGGEDRAGP
jgi:hypothetical protein